jgi:programmed cell death protein 5
VKPEKAAAVEALIVRMARSGQLGGKLTDDGLKKLLDQVAGQQKTTTVKVSNYASFRFICYLV